MRPLMQARLIAALMVALPAWAQSQPSRWDAAMEAGKTAYEQGRYEEAEKQLQAALGEAESFEKNDPRLAATLDQLITVYRTEGKPMLAEPHYHRLLGIQEGTWGPMDPRLVTVLNGLGTLYTANRQWAEAESIYQRALAIREKALGGEHPAPVEPRAVRRAEIFHVPVPVGELEEGVVAGGIVVADRQIALAARGEVSAEDVGLAAELDH